MAIALQKIGNVIGLCIVQTCTVMTFGNRLVKHTSWMFLIWMCQVPFFLSDILNAISILNANLDWTSVFRYYYYLIVDPVRLGLSYSMETFPFFFVKYTIRPSIVDVTLKKKTSLWFFVHKSISLFYVLHVAWFVFFTSLICCFFFFGFQVAE